MRDANRGALRAAAATVFALMVLFDPWGWQVFAPVKWLVATVGVAVMAMTMQRWSIHRASAVVWGAALTWGVIVSIVAVDPLYTWIGTPDRHLGLVAWMLFAVAFAAGQSIAAEAGGGWLLRTGVVATLTVTVVGVLEWVGRPLVDLTTASARIGATRGRPPDRMIQQLSARRQALNVPWQDHHLGPSPARAAYPGREDANGNGWKPVLGQTQRPRNP